MTAASEASDARAWWDRARAVFRHRSFAPMVIAAAVLLRYGNRPWGALSNPDDLDIIGHALEFGPLEILFSPEKYGTLSDGNFTPLLSLSLQLDTVLFGLWLPGYWMHTLLSVTVAMLLFYALLRCLSVPKAGALAATLFLLSTPVLVRWTGGLHVRHYLEGFAFAMGALLLGVRGLREARRERPGGPGDAASGSAGDGRHPIRWMVAAGGLMLVACLYKEIYVVVPFLLLAAPLPAWTGGELARRVRLVSPALAACAFYLAWRGWMMSGPGGVDPASAGLIGGAGDGGGLLDVSALRTWLADLPRRVRSVTSSVVSQLPAGWGTHLSALLVAGSGVASAVVLARRWQLPLPILTVFAAFTALIFIVLEVPIALFGIQPRWMTLLVTGLITYVAWSLAKLGGRVSAVVPGLFGALAIHQFFFVPPPEAEFFTDVTISGWEFARQSEPGELLYIVVDDPFMMRHLSGIGPKAELFQGEKGGIASTGPLVNHALGLEDLACHVPTESEPYARVPDPVCFGGKEVRELPASETGDTLTSWFAALDYDPEGDVLYATATEEVVHVVLYEGDYYVHATSGSLFPMILTRPYIRRSWVDPERALVRFAVERDDHFLTTAPLPLTALDVSIGP